MKLLFAICLLSSVVSREFCAMIDSYSADISHMETTYEGESEKETKENAEEFFKVKMGQGANFTECLGIQGTNSLFDQLLLSTPFMEINSPPPELH